MVTDSSIKVAIIGAQGYSGRELARLVWQHPHLKLAAVFSRDREWSLHQELSELNKTAIPHYTLDDLSQLLPTIDLVFLATPVETSIELTPLILKHNVKVIDLSGAFRLPLELFNKWYGEEHHASELIDVATYGLQPWNMKSSNLITNPGCYATSVLMALLPLLKAKLIDPDNIIVDAKSGLTGAGRQAKRNLLFCEMAEDFYPYKIGKHQHIPEIVFYAEQYAKTDIQLTLTTQVLPIKRGISAALYLQLNSNKTVKDIEDAYQTAYENYPLVRHANLDENSSLLSLKKVVGSCRTHLSYHISQNRLTVFSCIDNLLKGAASQAIENCNILYNFPVTMNLLTQEGTL